MKFLIVFALVAAASAAPQYGELSTVISGPKTVVSGPSGLIQSDAGAIVKAEGRALPVLPAVVAPLPTPLAAPVFTHPLTSSSVVTTRLLETPWYENHYARALPYWNSGFLGW